MVFQGAILHFHISSRECKFRTQRLVANSRPKAGWPSSLTSFPPFLKERVQLNQHCRVGYLFAVKSPECSLWVLAQKLWSVCTASGTSCAWHFSKSMGWVLRGVKAVKRLRHENSASAHTVDRSSKLLSGNCSCIRIESSGTITAFSLAHSKIAPPFYSTNRYVCHFFGGLSLAIHVHIYIYMYVVIYI